MIRVGDYVSVLDEDLNGTVLKVSQGNVTIETDEGFTLDFNEHEVVKIEDDSALNLKTFSSASINEVLTEKEQPKKRRAVDKPSKKKEIPAMEVDLHIHNLTDNSSRMTNFDMLNLQLDTARGQLEFAIRKRIQRVVFIHGVGEGVLKMELEQLLDRYDNLQYYDANYQKYGVGATEVYIFQNPK